MDTQKDNREKETQLVQLNDILRDISLACSKCGNILHYSIQGEQREKIIIFVKPCSNCCTPEA